MMKFYEFDVFLSHSSRDRRRILPIAEKLEGSGFSVWTFERQIQAGDSIPQRLEHGLANSRILVLAMTRNTFLSDWISLERQTFQFRDPINRERRFIPLLMDSNVNIPDSLRHFAYIDFRRQSASRFQQLEAACRQETGSGRNAQDQSGNEGGCQGLRIRFD